MENFLKYTNKNAIWTLALKHLDVAFQECNLMIFFDKT